MQLERSLGYSLSHWWPRQRPEVPIPWRPWWVRMVACRSHGKRADLRTCRGPLRYAVVRGGGHTPITAKSSEPSTRAVRLVTAGGAAIKGLVAVKAENEVLQAAYTFTPEQDVVLNSLHVGAEFSIAGTGGRQLEGGRAVRNFPGRIRRDRTLQRRRAPAEISDCPAASRWSFVSRNRPRS